MAEQKIKINKRYNDHKLIRKFFPIRYLSLSANEYGELSASSITGRLGMTSLLIPIPSYDCYFNDYEVTGGTINGDTYTFGDMDGTAKANFNRNVHHVILETAFGGTISADKTSGYHNDIVTLSTEQTAEAPFSFFSANGATLTGNQFTFDNNDVSAKAIYGYPVIYENDGHGTLTGEDFANPVIGTVLNATYNDYYRLSGYDVTGGYIEDGKLYATAACTAKAIFKQNYFSASGKFDLVEDTLATANVHFLSSISYAYYEDGYNVPINYINSIRTSFTKDITSSTNNCWIPTGQISGYNFSGECNTQMYKNTTDYTGASAMSIFRVNNNNFGNGSTYNRSDFTSFNMNANGNTDLTGDIKRVLVIDRVPSEPSRVFDFSIKLINSIQMNTWSASGIAP